MPLIPFDSIRAYRLKTFRTMPGQRLKSPDEAAAFINERGFVYFWPISRITLPSLWVAVAGDRPVADEHDDPGHITWRWKDDALGGRLWYYAKVLRKRATMISLAVVPYFYALSENYGAPDEDYLTLYEQGRLTQEARSVYEALLDNGPLDTVALRKATRMSSAGSEARFNRALADLQADFKIVPAAVTQAGAWHYAFAYDVVHRHYPELPEQAMGIRESEAYLKLAELFLRSVGAAQTRDLVKLFGWRAPAAERALQVLAEAGALCLHVEIEGHPGDWSVLAELV